ATTHNGLATFSAGASSSTGFEITTGNLGINSGNATDPRLEVGGTASISGALTLNGVSYTFPATQGSASSFLQNNGSGTLTWANPKIVTSNSLDFDELANALSVDANTTITGGLFSLTFDHASTSGIFEAGTLKTDTISGSTGSVISLSNSATESLNFEVVGYASASKLFGAGLSACGTNNALQWSSTGLFNCSSTAFQSQDATLTALAAYNTNGILVQTAADTFTGRTITGTANQITVANGDGVSANPTLSIPNSFIAPGAASVSTNFEVLGTASISSTLNVKGTSTFVATTHNGLATFSAGASSSTGFEITTGNLGINSGNATDTRLEVGGTASISGALTLNGVSYTFPATQGSASSFLQNNGSGTLTWATPKIVTSNSLDFDELANALSVDANTTITGGLFSLTFDHASTSGIFEAGTLKTDTISGSTGSVISLSNSATESLN